MASHDLPSLLALRGFEAAARHGSFSRAAEELSVTQAAISHQVRGLEEELGYKLFWRRPRKVTLTEEGRVLMVAVGRALAEIRQALGRLEAQRDKRWITISVSPSLAVKWLVPRLSAFAAAHPGIEVRLSATGVDAIPGRDGVDLGIRYGEGDYHGLDVELLIDEVVFPVCSAALWARAPLAGPDDLADCTLLHDEMFAEHPKRLDWAHWAEHFGLDLDPGAGLRFSHACNALDAALAGQGVALARSSLVADDLRAGRLVRPLPMMHASSFAYYLVLPRGERPSEAVSVFISWLKEEVAATKASLEAGDLA